MSGTEKISTAELLTGDTKSRQAAFYILGELIADTMGSQGLLRNCLSCDNFIQLAVWDKTKPPYQCKLFRGHLVPAQVIIIGCPSHTEIDEIPF